MSSKSQAWSFTEKRQRLSTMDPMNLSRRNYLKLLGAGAAVAATDLSFLAAAKTAEGSGLQAKQPAESAATIADRERRMKWWHEGKFGMFIHWGLYSVLGRHDWVMEMEGIPATEYQEIAKRFKPKPNAARDWARLAKRAGQKYMVMTTKHHEGFCHFDTKTTDYC